VVLLDLATFGTFGDLATFATFGDFGDFGVGVGVGSDLGVGWTTSRCIVENRRKPSRSPAATTVAAALLRLICIIGTCTTITIATITTITIVAIIIATIITNITATIASIATAITIVLPRFQPLSMINLLLSQRLLDRTQCHRSFP
jgi:hypothetical protein